MTTEQKEQIKAIRIYCLQLELKAKRKNNGIIASIYKPSYYTEYDGKLSIVFVPEWEQLTKGPQDSLQVISSKLKQTKNILIQAAPTENILYDIKVDDVQGYTIFGRPVKRRV